MGLPGRYDMHAYKNTDFTKNLTFTEDDKGIDFANYSAKMEVKEDYEKAAVLTLTDGNEITLNYNGIKGALQIEITESTLDGIEVNRYLYDLHLTDGNGYTTSWLEGWWILHNQVTD
jgi:hypothetical protein